MPGYMWGSAPVATRKITKRWKAKVQIHSTFMNCPFMEALTDSFCLFCLWWKRLQWMTFTEPSVLLDSRTPNSPICFFIKELVCLAQGNTSRSNSPCSLPELHDSFLGKFLLVSFTQVAERQALNVCIGKAALCIEPLKAQCWALSKSWRCKFHGS